ncbi:MAG: hypothetical protein JXX14_03745 [Deltaproteobacteria bacterium]|nr:hypothetical protein [Deltaproteobacteria bacterium]
MDNTEISLIMDRNNRHRQQQFQALSPEERMARFEMLQGEMEMLMSDKALRHFHARNHNKRRVRFEDGKWFND